MTNKHSIRVIRHKITEAFFDRFIKFNDCCYLTIVSPWISDLNNMKITLQEIINKIDHDEIGTYVITREPLGRDKWHVKAIEMMKQSPNIAIYFNNNVHAKIYISENVFHSFALLGSANLTKQGLMGHEIGLLILGYGDNIRIIYDLKEMTQVDLRSRYPDTVEIKKWDLKRKRNIGC